MFPATMHFRVGLLLVVTAHTVAFGVPPAPSGNVPAFQMALSGFDAMRDARWNDAQEAFSESIALGLDSDELHLARGVALALDGQFEAGARDLDRMTLREAVLWRYVVDQMSGTTGRSGSGVPVPKSLQERYGYTSDMSVSIPGHLVQGGDDYPTDYASFVFYQLARPYREAKDGGNLQGNRDVADAIAKAGRWFANRWTAKETAFALPLFERSTRQFRAGEHRASLETLAYVRFNFPADADVNFLIAENCRLLGRADTAREYYTRSLTFAVNHAEAYLGRAECAARVGDLSRMDKDLKTAEDLGANPERVRVIRALADTPRSSMDPIRLYAALEAAATDGRSLGALVPLAERLRRAVNEGRLDYAEWYQDQLRERIVAFEMDSSSANAAVKLARFLVDESPGRGEAVEPRRGVTPYRFQLSESDELRRAVGYADAALQRDAMHIEARVVKALALLELGQEAASRRLVDEVMSRTGFDHPEALKLYAEYKFRRAGGQLMQAFGLRMPSYSTSTRREWRSDGLWEVRTTTRTDPSAGDLARAAEAQRLARANLREAELAMQKAVRLTRGTLEGLLWEADFEHWYRSRERAGELLVRAVTEHPDSLKARDKLAWWFKWMGADDKAVQARAGALRLVHTTGDPYLGKIWRRLERNQRNDAWADLMEAKALDPSDARVAAYAGSLYEARKDFDKAQIQYKVALALEEARLGVDRSREVPSNSTLDLVELALAFELRQRLGLLAEQKGNPGKALQFYTASIQDARRVGPGAPAQPMFGSMLPDPNAPMMPRPLPKNGADLMAQAYLRAGLLQLGGGETQRAREWFTGAASYGRPPGWMMPQIGTDKGDNNFNQYASTPASEAQYELARMLQAAGDVDGARALMQAAYSNTLPEHRRREMIEFDESLVRILNQRMQQQADEDYRRQQADMEAELLEQERLARQRSELQRAGAAIDPVLVGVWKLGEESSPYSQQPKHLELTLNADGSYEWNEEGRRSAGKVRAWNNRMTLTPSAGEEQQLFYRHLQSRSFTPGAPDTSTLQLIMGNSGPVLLEKD